MQHKSRVVTQRRRFSHYIGNTVFIYLIKAWEDGKTELLASPPKSKCQFLIVDTAFKYVCVCVY